MLKSKQFHLQQYHIQTNNIPMDLDRKRSILLWVWWWVCIHILFLLPNLGWAGEVKTRMFLQIFNNFWWSSVRTHTTLLRCRLSMHQLIKTRTISIKEDLTRDKCHLLRIFNNSNGNLLRIIYLEDILGLHLKDSTLTLVIWLIMAVLVKVAAILLQFTHNNHLHLLLWVKTTQVRTAAIAINQFEVFLQISTTYYISSSLVIYFNVLLKR